MTMCIVWDAQAGQGAKVNFCVLASLAHFLSQFVA